MVNQIDALILPDLGNVQVDHGRSDRLVTQSLLHRLDILASFQQMGGIRMTQGMSGKRGVETSHLQDILQALANEAMIDPLVCTESLEDKTHAGVTLAIRLQDYQCLRGDGYNTGLLALTILDMDLLAVETDVIPLELAGLESSESAVIDHREQGLRVEFAGVKQEPYLLYGQDTRQLSLSSDLGE